MNNGFNSPCSDEPLPGNPRVHEEGRHNYERNNRSSDWFAHSSRVSSEAKSAAEPQTESTPEPQTEIKPELQTEAKPESHSKSAKVDEVKSEVSAQEDLKRQPEQPRNGPIKEVITEQLNGEHVNNLTESYNNLQISPKTATKNADKPKREPVTPTEGIKSPRESKLGRLHQESTSSSWDQIPHRLRAEGEGFARRNNRDSVTDIFQNNNYPVQRQEAKVSNDSTVNSPRRPPTPRVRSDGLQNLQRSMNHSEMSAIMHGSPVQAAPPRTSGDRKILPHLQRSELW